MKVHARSVPYLGGVAVLVAIAGPVLGERPSLLVPLGLACALGLVDDAAGLPPAVRLAAEIGLGVSAAIAVGHHGFGRVVLGVVVVLVLVNAVNLLDGLDGLAAGVTLAAAAGFYVVLAGAGATLALVLAGAVAGFLVWNAPPARVYLGDAGSYLIGTALAMLFLAAAQRPAEVVSGACLFLAVPVADTAIAIVRRFRAGGRCWPAIAGHVYDQLVDRGWPAPAAVVACVAAQAALTGAGIAIAVDRLGRDHGDGRDGRRHRGRRDARLHVAAAVDAREIARPSPVQEISDDAVREQDGADGERHRLGIGGQ